MKHRNNHFAVGYWSLIRRGRPTPDQVDIDPKALKRLLPFTFLLDARQSSFAYRLAGTTLCERYGCELRGRSFLSHWDRDSRSRLPPLLKLSLAEATPICLSSVATTEDCRMVELETVLMPLTFNGEARERFLGVAQLLTDVSPLMDRSISYQSLVTSALVREGDRTTGEAPPPAAPIPFRPRASSRTARGEHLKLVISQAQPAIGHALRFDGNDALAALQAQCEADAKQGGGFGS